jgi:hypothetical protein
MRRPQQRERGLPRPAIPHQWELRSPLTNVSSRGSDLAPRQTRRSAELYLCGVLPAAGCVLADAVSSRSFFIDAGCIGLERAVPHASTIENRRKHLLRRSFRAVCAHSALRTKLRSVPIPSIGKPRHKNRRVNRILCTALLAARNGSERPVVSTDSVCAAIPLSGSRTE